MSVKHCCIGDCYSSSIRPEDVGVTYHKYPKNKSLRNVWLEITQHNEVPLDSPLYVCSRHFRKSDFQVYKDSKYILKPDAVPSIFPWAVNNSNMDENNGNTAIEGNSGDDQLNIEELFTTEQPKDLEIKVTIDTDDDQDQEVISLNDNKAPGESLEAIKKFIEEQEKEIQILESEVKPVTATGNKNVITNAAAQTIGDVKVKNEVINTEDVIGVTLKTETPYTSDLSHDVSQASQGIDAMDEALKKVKKPKAVVGSPGEKGGSMALSVGSKVEAKDFSELWYPAKIVEVDYDEMEVLVQYDNKKHDEWISVSSPRLRPIGSGPREPPPDMSISSFCDSLTVKEEPKPVEKPKIEFKVGDRCLARYRDNRRFAATICTELENGDYEIMFDDGFRWTCGANRLYKMKEEGVSVPLDDSTGSIGPTSGLPPGLPYQTHLFDPSRDYLGSKSERRERKRKLNIKEIFNIGQKKKKIDDGGKTDKRPRIIRRKTSPAVPKPVVVIQEVKPEIPAAVASIIGTQKPEPSEVLKEVKLEIEKMDMSKISDVQVTNPSQTTHKEEIEVTETKVETEVPLDHEAVMDKLKDVLTKSEPQDVRPDGAIVIEVDPNAETSDNAVTPPPDIPKKHKDLSKIKKAKKIRMMRDKKVKSEVERVKSELERVKKQVEEMKKQVGKTAEQFYKMSEHKKPPLPMPDNCLGPDEWCAKWVNGQPLGTVSELEPCRDDKGGLPRRSVQVEDKRLPPGWSKHMVRRSLGSSAGKWDVVLISPDNKRFHTKTDMRHYLESIRDETLSAYETALFDFGVHRKLAKRLGWDTYTDSAVDTPLPCGTLNTTSPLVKTKKFTLSLQRRETKGKIAKKKKRRHVSKVFAVDPSLPVDDEPSFIPEVLEEGYVYVGALKVQILENLLRCPAEGCFKNFRNNTLLKMHIKHYHRELRKMLGATPKVEELASARSKVPRPSDGEHRTPKIKIPKIPKRLEEPRLDYIQPTVNQTEVSTTPVKVERLVPRSQDSPRLRNALLNKPGKRPKVLLPVRRTEDESEEIKSEIVDDKPQIESLDPHQLDFESAISTHTVTKPVGGVDKKKMKGDKKKKTFAVMAKEPSEDEEYMGGTSDLDTRLSFPRSGTPDKFESLTQPMSSESNEEVKQQQYMVTETGEKIKIVHMKREEIINCHCGVREEDGLMIQCELCLCWQHALCHNIHREAEVPEKYTCSICLNPRRGRRSKRFLHDQDRMYEGVLPGAAACETLRRSHELTGNLILMDDALYATRVKIYVASNKNHPKLYLWAKDWESPEPNLSQDKLTNEYLDLNAMISAIGKENLPLKDDLKDISLGDLRSPSSEDPGFQPGQLGSQALLSGLLSSPGGGSLDLPISAAELEKLAKSVQESERASIASVHTPVAPQPEAAIENSACRARLLQHIRRCQAAVDARLDSIEAQVAELESQDPSFEDDETADYFPRTKQTIQMLLRDLDTMEELGVIT